MKTKIYLSCLLSMSVFLFSCSNDKTNEENNTATQSFSHVRVETITDDSGQSRSVIVPDGPLEDFINNYVVFDENDNQYHITISKSEAIDLGIDAAEYDEVVKSVNEGNKMLADMLEEYSKRDDIKSITINNSNIKQ